MGEPAWKRARAVEAAAERLARWTRAALEVSAGVGYSAFLLVEAKLAARDPQAFGILQWIAVGALIALPLFPSTLERVLHRTPRLPAVLLQHAWILQLVPLALLDLREPAHLLLGALALLQGNLLVRSSDGRLAAWSIALGPALVLAGMAVVPSAEWLLLYPLSLLAAIGALILLQARAVEEDVLERAPRVLLGRRSEEVRRIPREWAARLASAVPLGLVVLLAVPPFYLLVMAARGPLVGLWSDGARADLAEGRGGADPGRREPGAGPTTQQTVRGFFPESLTLGGSARQLAHRAVMEIVPRRLQGSGGGRPRTLYMRGLVLDTFGRESADFGGGLAPALLAADPDGWTRLSPSPAGELMELEVALQPLFIGDGWSNVLFAPHPVVAIDQPAALYHPDDRLTLPFAPQETIDYRLIVPDQEGAGRGPRGGAARHPDARYVQLPAARDELEWISARATEAMRGARDDAQRVQRLLAYFHGSYAYSLDARSLPGIEGVVDFMERREGHCTYFAVAAVLMLRSQRIPARVATGYLASDWDDEDELFRVTTRNGHAWIEVHFADQGWITFDPTPAARREAALAAAETDPERSLGTWFQDLRENALFWSTTGGHEAYLDSLIETLSELPAALLATARRHAGALALALLALVLLWAWRRSRASSAAGAVEGWSGPSEARGLYQRLLRALAARGFRRRPAETLREFATATRERGGDRYAPLLPITASLYRVRFGRVPLPPGEARAIEAFLGQLERAPTEAPGAGVADEA